MLGPYLNKKHQYLNQNLTSSDWEPQYLRCGRQRYSIVLSSPAESKCSLILTLVPQPQKQNMLCKIFTETSTKRAIRLENKQSIGGKDQILPHTFTHTRTHESNEVREQTLNKGNG